jgi:hypothetical protein
VRRARHPPSHLRAGRQPRPAEIAFQAAPQKSRGDPINYLLLAAAIPPPPSARVTPAPPAPAAVAGPLDAAAPGDTGVHIASLTGCVSGLDC